MIKSVNYDQSEILRDIISLHVPGGFECDLTYGNGSFYKNVNPPALCFDKEPLSKHVIAACSTSIPLKDESVSSVVFDPPFLTYIKSGRNHKSIMGKRFSGYWRYSELEDHYQKTIADACRVLKKKGVLVFKCQDIIHNHKLHSTHINVVNWAKDMFRLKDMFILAAKNRMPVGVTHKQQHARIYHSYFLVLEKQK